MSYVKDVQSDNALWYKLHVFVYDLRNFREISESRTRLDSIVDASYIGEPYFTSLEASKLKNTVVDVDEGKPLQTLIEETLFERLDRRAKKRVESNDYRVCAAHDLAPILEKAFDINPKELAKSREFLDLLGRSGLELKSGDRWEGLPKKPFHPKNKKKH